MGVKLAIAVMAHAQSHHSNTLSHSDKSTMLYRLSYVQVNIQEEGHRRLVLPAQPVTYGCQKKPETADYL